MLRILSAVAAVAVVASGIYFSAKKVKLSYASSMSRSYASPLIIIDAGHGGFDGGAVASDGTSEKDINLAISLRLNSILNALGYRTLMVRTTDKAVDTKGDKIKSRKRSDIMYRYSLMKKNPDSVYLCIHQNFFTGSGSHGAQIFYSPNDDGSKILAQSVQDMISTQVQKDNKRQIKRCTDHVYLIHNAVVPAVLIECGFISNPNDLRNLKSEDYQGKISFAIACGLIRWLGGDCT